LGVFIKKSKAKGKCVKDNKAGDEGRAQKNAVGDVFLKV